MPLVTTTEMFKGLRWRVCHRRVQRQQHGDCPRHYRSGLPELNSPVILQVSAGARKYAKHVYLMKLVEAAIADTAGIPIALHLDHRRDFEICQSLHRRRILLGHDRRFLKGFEENIADQTGEVEYAHAHGVVGGR